MHSLKTFTSWQGRRDQIDMICDVVSNEAFVIWHISTRDLFVPLGGMYKRHMAETLSALYRQTYPEVKLD